MSKNINHISIHKKVGQPKGYKIQKTEKFRKVHKHWVCGKRVKIG